MRCSDWTAECTLVAVGVEPRLVGWSSESPDWSVGTVVRHAGDGWHCRSAELRRWIAEPADDNWGTRFRPSVEGAVVLPAEVQFVDYVRC